VFAKMGYLAYFGTPGHIAHIKGTIRPDRRNLPAFFSGRQILKRPMLFGIWRRITRAIRLDDDIIARGFLPAQKVPALVLNFAP
jgi:hypothetical protein